MEGQMIKTAKRLQLIIGGIWSYNQFSNNYKKVVTQKTKDSIRLDKPHEFASVTTHSAFNAYKQVLDYAGVHYTEMMWMHVL